MKIGIFRQPEKEKHVKVLNCLYDGFKNCRENVEIYDMYQGYQQCDILVTFGISKIGRSNGNVRGHLIPQLVKSHNGKPWLVIERGYIHRDKYYSVGWSGLNGRANFCNENSPPDRWNKLNIKLSPWRDDNKELLQKYILLCGQIPWDSSVQHSNHIEWCRHTYKILQEHTRRDIVFRPHGQKGQITIKNAIYSNHSNIDDDLQNAWATVTFNSNCGVDSLIAGVPAYACDKGSMIWNVCNKDLLTINKPIKISRLQWVCDLAYTQWNLIELQTGEAWKHICRGLR